MGAKLSVWMRFVKKMTDGLLWNRVDNPTAPLLILAHGAGAPADSDWMNRVADLFYEGGISTLRFEFPYMQKRRLTGKKSAPDRAPVLLDTWRDILCHKDVVNYKGAVFIGGKSMGGRMATLIASGNTDTRLETPQSITTQITGCICFGYPFHPPGKLDALRTDHLGNDYSTPTLIVQGEKDTFGTREQVDGYTLSPMIEMAWLTAGNHDLKPNKASGFTHDDHLQSAVTESVHFMMGQVNV